MQGCCHSPVLPFEQRVLCCEIRGEARLEGNSLSLPSAGARAAALSQPELLFVTCPVTRTSWEPRDDSVLSQLVAHCARLGPCCVRALLN